MILKSFARKIIFPSVTAPGLEKLLLFLSRNKRMILMYHGVVPQPDFSISGGHIDKTQFEKHLIYLKKNFNVVSTAEIFDMYRNGTIPAKHTIAITFDDGYENNFTHALPLLIKHQLPATFFIATQCIEDETAILWYDKLYFIKHKISFADIDYSKAAVEESKKIRVKNCSSNSEFVDLFKTFSTLEKEEFFKIIKQKIDFESVVRKAKPDLWKMMSKEQLSSIANTPGMELGSHTHTHPNLGNIEMADAINELKKSKQLLEQVSSGRITAVAFPDGNYSEEIKKACLNLGYSNLFAVDYHLKTDPSDKTILPRFCISCTTTAHSNFIQINAGFGKSGF